MGKNNEMDKEQQQKALGVLAELVGKGVTEIYKMFVRNVIIQGLILALFAACLIGGGIAVAVGLTMPIWSWVLIAVGVGFIAWAISLLANPAYHALDALLETIRERHDS